MEKANKICQMISNSNASDRTYSGWFGFSDAGVECNNITYNIILTTKISKYKDKWGYDISKYNYCSYYNNINEPFQFDKELWCENESN